MSKRIGIAAVIWGVSVLLSRVVGVLRESVIGRVLGGGGEADVYWSAFVLPDFLNYLLAGGALSIVFIPIFAGYLERGDEAGGWRVFSSIANFVLVVMGAATVVAWLLAPWIVPELAPGFTPEQLEHLTSLTRIILPAQLFHIVGGLLSASLQARDKHLLPALATLGYTGGIVGMGLALGPTWGSDAFAWGVLLGSAIGPFGLPLIGCIHQGMGEGSFGWRLRVDLKHPDFKRYLWLSLPIMLAFSIMVVDDWLLKRYGSLAGEGTVSSLQYGKTLMKVPMGVFGMATGAAAFPTLSRLVAQGKPVEAYDTLIRACRMMLVLAFASQAAFTVAGADVAEVIWGTERFTPAQLDEIGLYTGLFCLALGAWSANTVVARGYYAQQLTWLPSLIGTAMVLLFWPVYRGLGLAFGGAGLALASSLAVGTYVTVLSVVLRRRMGGPDSPALWTLVVRMVPSVLAGVGAGHALDGALVGLPALLRGALTGTLALVLTLVTARVLGVPEVSEVVALFWGKLKRKLGRDRA